MGILQTIRQIITREKDDLLNKNTPIAAKLAADNPILYTFNPSQRSIDRKLIDGTVSRYYLSKGFWSYAARGHKADYIGTIPEWRTFCNDLTSDICTRIRALPSHQEYLERVTARKEANTYPNDTV